MASKPKDETNDSSPKDEASDASGEKAAEVDESGSTDTKPLSVSVQPDPTVEPADPEANGQWAFVTETELTPQASATPIYKSPADGGPSGPPDQFAETSLDPNLPLVHTSRPLRRWSRGSTWEV